MRSFTVTNRFLFLSSFLVVLLNGTILVFASSSVWPIGLHPFSRQIAMLRTPANAVHAASGPDRRSANLIEDRSSRRVLMSPPHDRFHRRPVHQIGLRRQTSCPGRRGNWNATCAIRPGRGCREAAVV